MPKGKLSKLTDIIEGGGMPVKLVHAMATAVNLDIAWEDIRPIDSPNIVPDVGTRTQAHIISNVHLAYEYGYDAYLTLVYSGEVAGYGLPTAEAIILSIKNGEFKFNNSHPAVVSNDPESQAIALTKADAKNSLIGFFADHNTRFDGLEWFSEERSKIILDGYSESLNLKVNPVYNCFDVSLREQLDASIRESAIELMRQPPRY